MKVYIINYNAYLKGDYNEEKRNRSAYAHCADINRFNCL